MASNSNPALSYTLDDFIEMKLTDDMTYYNFSILEVVNSVQHLDHNLIEDYIDELSSASLKVNLSDKEYKRYRYNPDLLAYDIYGSVQLDTVVMLLNDCIDPKEFDMKSLKLPYASVLGSYLNTIYSKESEYIAQNRINNGLLIH